MTHLTVGSINFAPSQVASLGAAIGKWPYAGEGEAAVYAGHPRQPANDNYPRVVALTGAAGSGKSTAADYLIRQHGYERVKFAGPLKDMCRAIGLTEDHIEGRLKEVPSDMLCGKTPRYLMQALGTELGRNLIGEDFWIRLWLHRVAGADRVVVDDCRFPNEAAAVRSLGGVIIKLEGRGGIAGAHASEAGCGTWDSVVENDGCVTDLYAGVEEAIRRAA
jgi:hypothetical protein